MEKRRFNWMSLIVGILFLVVSFILLINPSFSLEWIVIYVAIVAIVEGVLELFFRHQLHKQLGIENKHWVSLVMGILLIVLGIVLLFNISFGMEVLPYIFAFWFVIDSVDNLFLLDFARLVGKGYYWFTLIASLLGIFLGVWLFMNPVASSVVCCYLVSLFFMWFGIQYIWEAFVLRY